MATQPIYALTDTWDTTATTYAGLSLSVTDTASAAGSNLLELRGGAAGTTSLFSVRKDGYATISNLLGTIGLWAGATQGLFVRPDQARFTVGSNGRFSFSANTNAGSTEDTGFNLDAANTLAQRNGTNPQAFRIYNTFTDASNYERAKIAWDTNVLKIGTEKLGTGTARALEFQTDGVTRLTIGTGATNPVTFCGFSFTTSASNGVFSSTWLTLAAGGLSINASGAIQNVALRLGGTTSSFPAIVRDTTTLKARLADDSTFTNIQGKLTTETAYTAGAPTATGYLVLYDSNGTAYKVPAEAL